MVYYMSKGGDEVYKKYLLLAAALLCLVLQLLPTHAALLPLSQGEVSPTQTESDPFLWPVGDHRHITSGFGNRKIALYGYERLHTGVDINTATGTPVAAIADGTVIVSVYDGGWGDYIMINHGNNLISLYAHLDSRTVSRGDTVTAGQLIGTTGNSGISSGPHLHFELREHGKAINPFRYTFH